MSTNNQNQNNLNSNKHQNDQDEGRNTYSKNNQPYAKCLRGNQAIVMAKK